MPDEDGIEIPSQPPGEQAKLMAGWTSLAVVSLLVAFLNTPYDITKQSPIMVKTETVINIVSGRRTFKEWPLDEGDKKFGYGELANLEPIKPTFKYLKTELDTKDPSIEEAFYDFNFRNESLKVKARFNPHEKPKRRFF